MNRAVAIARIQLIGWSAFLWPLAILATSFVINVALFAAIGDDVAGPHVTGGIASIYLVQFFVCSQVMIQMFSFTAGLNASRRSFFLGTVLVVVVQSIAYGVLLYLLKLVEHGTDGWGLSLGFFDFARLTHSNSPAQILVYTVPMAVLSFAGMCVGVAAKRWGNNGVLALSMATVFVLGAIAVLISLTRQWSTVGDWLADQTGPSLAVGWALIPLVVFAFGAFTLLRRATP